MTQISPVGDNRKDLVTVFIDNIPYIDNPSAIGSEDLARVEVIKGSSSHRSARRRSAAPSA